MAKEESEKRENAADDKDLSSSTLSEEDETSSNQTATSTVFLFVPEIYQFS